jgi:hypothetical protein
VYVAVRRVWVVELGQVEYMREQVTSIRKIDKSQGIPWLWLAVLNWHSGLIPRQDHCRKM